MIWSEFVTAVESHLAVEANRRGMETFRARYIRNGVLDLQRYIRRFRAANTTVYTASDVTDEGEAQLVTMPENAKPKAFYIYSVDTELNDPLFYRYRLEVYPWNSRYDMINGRLTAIAAGACCDTSGCGTALTDDEQQVLLSKAYRFAMSPHGRNAIIYPKITASTRLLLVWEGYKYEWDDDDAITFPEEASEAVAAYVQARITRNVDKNLQLAREFDAEWQRLRLSLYRDFNETQDFDEKDEEYETLLLSAMTPNSLVGYGTSTNNSGNTTISIGSTKINWSELTTVGGAGSTTRIIILEAATVPVTGAVLRHRCLMPATAGITIEWRNATAGGTLLTSYVSDASGDDVVADFIFNGTTWAFDRFIAPANA